MDIKLIIVFVVINLTFAGIIGMNGYFYYRSSEAKFKGIVKTQKDNIEHVIEDYFKDSELSKVVIRDILQDSLNVIDKNLEVQFEKQQSTFVRAGNNYALTMTREINSNPDETTKDFFVKSDMSQQGLIKKKIDCTASVEHTLLQPLEYGILATGENYGGSLDDHKDLIVQVERV